MKRAISAFLAAVVLALNFAACDLSPKATSASEFKWKEKGDGYWVGAYIGDSKDVVIPSKVNGKPVTGIKIMAFSRSEIETLTIPDSVVTIEDSAFEYCTSLKHITFGKNVEQAFNTICKGCENLESITFTGNVKVIGYTVFFYTNLKTVTFCGDKMPTIYEFPFPKGTEVRYKKGVNGWNEFEKKYEGKYTFVQF